METKPPSFEDNLLIETGEEGARIDQFLAKKFEGKYSRSYFQRLLEEELIRVNDQPVKKRYLVKSGDEVEVEFACLTEETSLTPEDIALDILYEDDDLVAINKPSGLVVHPAPGHWSGTFVNALLFRYNHLKELNPSLRPGIVHRLDKDTSGVLLAAKSLRAQALLIDLFSKRRVEKYYHALVRGVPELQRIDAPIGRSPRHRQKMALTENGRPAQTEIIEVKASRECAWLKIKLITGRTHQIRVHLQSIHHSVIGDALYGNPSINQKFKAGRQMLHAYSLAFEHPLQKGRRVEIIAPYPEDFAKMMIDCRIA